MLLNNRRNFSTAYNQHEPCWRQLHANAGRSADWHSDEYPCGILIKKTKNDITVECEKAGFTKASYLNHSGAAGATLGNIIAGGGIGWAVDSASGADNKYDPVMNITLVPVGSVPTPTITGASAPSS
jgi:hypothetical protein